MNPLRTFVLACMVAAAAAQDPAAGKGAEKGPSKEVAEQLAVLKEAQADKKFAQDARGVEAIDKLLIKAQAGVDPKDQTAIVKALESTLMTGKLRPSDQAQLYVGAAAALEAAEGHDRTTSTLGAALMTFPRGGRASRRRSLRAWPLAGQPGG